jgi:hypothetical protein
MICKEKAPCCGRICGQTGLHKIHEVKYGHQMRGLNGNVYEASKIKSPVVKRCECLAENDKIKFNGNDLSWCKFKEIFRNRNAGETCWSFNDMTNTQ